MQEKYGAKNGQIKFRLLSINKYKKSQKIGNIFLGKFAEFAPHRVIHLFKKIQ